MPEKTYTRRTVVGIATVGIGSSLAGCTSVYSEIGASSDDGQSGGDDSQQDGGNAGDTGQNDDSANGASGNDDGGGSDEDNAGSGNGNDGGGSTGGDSGGSDESGGGSTADVPEEKWEQPKPINGPIDEGKLDDRINDVDVINTIENGDGYADFDFQVGANTWMQDVDPAPDEPGEPYFAVKINDVLVTRTDQVAYRKQGSWELPVSTGALEQFDAGKLQIEILLLDVDGSRDDLYGRWEETLTYRP